MTVTMTSGSVHRDILMEHTITEVQTEAGPFEYIMLKFLVPEPIPVKDSSTGIKDKNNTGHGQLRSCPSWVIQLSWGFPKFSGGSPWGQHPQNSKVKWGQSVGAKISSKFLGVRRWGL